MIFPISATRLDVAIRGAGIPIDGVSVIDPVAHTVVVNYQASATPAHRISGAAIVTAFDWSIAADATYNAQQAKTEASAYIDNGSLQSGGSMDRIIVALALVLLDEINIIRPLLTTPQSLRNTTQLVNAVKAKIAASAE